MRILTRRAEQAKLALGANADDFAGWLAGRVSRSQTGAHPDHVLYNSKDNHDNDILIMVDYINDKDILL